MLTAGLAVVLVAPLARPPAVVPPAPAPAVGSDALELASVSSDLAAFVGFFIGDGADADPATCTAPCKGGDAGILRCRDIDW